MWTFLLVASVAAVRVDNSNANGKTLYSSGLFKQKVVNDAETKMPSLPEEWRSRFQIEKELGFGGDGDVYKLRVLCDGGDHWVSAKLLKSDEAKEKATERMELMEGEEHVISSIGDPASAETTDGRWIMMPFMNGGSFTDLMKECSANRDCMCQTRDHPSPCWETVKKHGLLWVLALFDNALDGVAAIHAKGYVHEDLKLDNIMVQCKGTSCSATIIDLDQMCPQGDCANAGGTPGFAPPEAYEGKKGLFANDVYSMGAVLYVLLYGEALPWLDFWWNEDCQRKQAAYKPEEDSNIPKIRRGIDDLVVEMLNTNHSTRIGLEEARKRLYKYIMAQNPDQEIIDMIQKFPSTRGVFEDLPKCVSHYDPSEFHPSMCRSKPTKATGWYSCGPCVFCKPCCYCFRLSNGRVKDEYFFADSCE